MPDTNQQWVAKYTFVGWELVEVPKKEPKNPKERKVVKTIRKKPHIKKTHVKHAVKRTAAFFYWLSMISNIDDRGLSTIYGL